MNGSLKAIRRTGLAAVLAAVALTGCRPAQMGPDEDVFRTVDALFTAVTSQRSDRLDQCEAALKAHRDAGKLPTEAWRELDAIIARARGGKWQSAAERLYDFMECQERAGAVGSVAVQPPKKAKRPGHG